MLTEAEKKWLRERRHENCETCKTHHLLCDRCSHIYPGSVWAWDRFTLSGLSVETTYEELKDAAEFEARVAAWQADNLPSCDFCKWYEECFKTSCARTRIKHARLAVEAEMEKE